MTYLFSHKLIFDKECPKSLGPMITVHHTLASLINVMLRYVNNELIEYEDMEDLIQGKTLSIDCNLYQIIQINEKQIYYLNEINETINASLVDQLQNMSSNIEMMEIFGEKIYYLTVEDKAKTDQLRYMLLNIKKDRRQQCPNNIEYYLTFYKSQSEAYEVGLKYLKFKIDKSDLKNMQPVRQILDETEGEIHKCLNHSCLDESSELYQIIDTYDGQELDVTVRGIW